jgi:hypothetical protein
MSIILKPPPSKPPARPTPPARTYDPVAGLLSYLVPGLGQIVRGRVGKGVLFLVCIYALFFYGMYQGHASVTVDDKTYTVNSPVYLPDNTDERNLNDGSFNLPTLAQNLYNRPQFVGQFWVGVAAWPAVWQYLNHGRERKLLEEADDLARRAENEEGADKEKTLQQAEEKRKRLREGDPLLGNFERQPTDAAINAVQTSGGKRLELAWVFTVIAGVLNIMVIYDAIAGPAFPLAGQLPPEKSTGPAPALLAGAQRGQA